MLVFAAMLFGTNSYAQANIKCPPTKSFFKSGNKKGFFKKKHKNRPQARVFYQPQEVTPKEEKVKETKPENKLAKRKEKPIRNRNNRAAARMQRVNGKQVATTKCPQR